LNVEGNGKLVYGKVPQRYKSIRIITKTIEIITKMPVDTMIPHMIIVIAVVTVTIAILRV